jgi:vancomycin resistance protein YoaR
MTQLALSRTPQNVAPRLRYEAAATEKILQQLAAVVDYPPQNAGVTIQPDGAVEMTLSQRGLRLHVGATRDLIEPALWADAPTAPHVTAFIQQVLPPLDTAEVTAVQQQARQFLAGPLLFTLADETGPQRWSLSPDQLTPMLSIVETPDAQGKPHLSLHLDESQLQPYLAALTQTINLTAANASLAFDEETNQLQIVEASRDGRVLDIEAAMQRVNEALVSGNRAIDLPVQLIEPAISSKKPEELGIVGLVAEATSEFKGSSEGRMKNIALAASKFDGVILQPNEVFSFNKYLGPITKEEGYDESLIIFGDRTCRMWAAECARSAPPPFGPPFNGGLPIVERWPHAYRVGWYETNSVPGLDATIYTPYVDLKFRNDTGHFLLIHTESDLEAGTVTFKFFGTRWNGT